MSCIDSVNNPEGFSSGIQNVLLKSERKICMHVLTVSTIWIRGLYSRAFHPVFEMFYSYQREKSTCMYRQCQHKPFLCSLSSIVSTVSTNIALNALLALIFILTVSTNKIPYSIHNSIALIFCINHLNMPHVHSNYNADSYTKSSNYSKIQFKPLIYFELQQSSN